MRIRSDFVTATKRVCRLTKPTPVRLYDNQVSRLRTVSRRFRLSSARLIRLAIDSQLTNWEQENSLVIKSTPHS
jgi:predicted DNA-binding protein